MMSLPLEVLEKAKADGTLWFLEFQGHFTDSARSLDEYNTKKSCYLGDPNWDVMRLSDFVICEYGNPNRFRGMSRFQIEGLIAAGLISSTSQTSDS